MGENSFAREFLRSLVIFLAGGFIYGAVEILYRGHTHPSMFVLGGICLLWVGGLNSFFRRTPPLWVQLLLGGVFITLAEFACGLVYNVWLGMKVWDYSKLPLNIMGQVCPMFFFAWVLLSFPAIIVEDVIRHRFSEKAG
ncbi:MAG: hypothetical protein J6N15_08600 [Ruminiclostridium sp.]|nr:hypothetical protein [Ruminiclostridium sp.]